jgi:hypothetical protein
MNLNNNHNIDILSQIKTVEAPPFLLTRIKQQIQNLNKNTVPLKWKWAFASAAILILTLNLTFFFKSTTFANYKENKIEKVFNNMELSAKIDLYNE